VCLISIAFKEQKERAQGFSGQHPEEVEVGEANCLTLPTRSSLVCGPYISAVSRNVTPISTACLMSLIISSSGLGAPYAILMPMQPNPNCDTSSPSVPSFTLGMLGNGSAIEATSLSISKI